MTADILQFLGACESAGVGVSVRCGILRLDRAQYEDVILRLRADHMASETRERLQLATAIILSLGAVAGDDARPFACPICGPIFRTRTIHDVMTEGTLDELRALAAEIAPSERKA